MKKLLLLFLLAPVIALSQNKNEYGLKYSSTVGSEIDDLIKRKIYQQENKIIIENYFSDLGINLSLIIDKKEENKEKVLIPRNDNAPWYYCHDESGYKYILIGLYTKRVELYCIYSDVEITKITFE